MTTPYQLSKPIEAHGEMVSILELNEPSVKMARKHGLPFSFGASEKMELNLDVVAHYISESAQIPMSSVDSLSLPDLMQLGWVIVGFFTGSAAAETLPPAQQVNASTV